MPNYNNNANLGNQQLVHNGSFSLFMSLFSAFLHTFDFFTTSNKLLFIAKERSNGHSYGKAVSYNTSMLCW